MDNKIKNIDENGNEFSIQRETSNGYETEIRSKNDILISQTILKDGKFESISYFVFSIEQLNKMIEQNNMISFIYRHFQNSYRIDEYLDYNNQILTGKMISVYNSNNESICFQKHQIVNGETISKFTEKSYYENGEEKYAFEYNQDGTCFMIDSVQTCQDDIFGWEIGTSKTNFTWKGFEYYQFQNPLLPEY